MRTFQDSPVFESVRNNRNTNDQTLLEKYGYDVVNTILKRADGSLDHELGLIIVSIDSNNYREVLHKASTIYAKNPIPMLFLSSSTDKEVMERAHEISHYGYVIKDSEGVGLLAALKTAFKLIEAEDREKSLKAKHNAIISSLNDLMFIIDRNGEFREVFATQNRLQYIQPQELINKKLDYIFNKEEAPKFLSYIQKCLNTGNLQTFECRLQLIDKPHNYETRITKYSEDCILAICHDLSEQKKSQAELLESKERLQDLIANIPVVVYCTKVVRNRKKTTFVSDTVVDILGYQPEDFTDNDDFLTSLIHPDDVDIISKNTMEIAGREEGLLPVIEYRLKNKEGHYHWIHDKQKIVSKTAEAIEIVGSWSDISDIKQYKKELKDIINRFDRLSEQSRSFFWSVDKEATYTSVNSIVKSVLGYEPEEMIGEKVWAFHPAKGREEFREKCLTKIELAQSDINFENPMLNKNGEIVWVTTTTMPLYDELNNFIGFQGIDSDISKRKRAEQEQLTLQEELSQSQKMEAIGKLAGGIAHNFNGSLTTISGLAELSLLKSDKSNPVYKYIQQILDATQRSAKLVQELLAYARKQPIDPNILNINHIVGNMTSVLRQLLGSTITIDWHPAEDLWQVLMDPNQIEQIIMNLCVNARDAISSKGKVTIETQNIADIKDMKIKPDVNETYEEYVLIKITDNGSGMSQETMSHIFEPFFTTKEKELASGLGLPTVLGIVHQNNGLISVESEVEKGTTFYVYLPRIKSALDGNNDEAGELADSKADKLVVLAVDDDESILEMLTQMLTITDYNVITQSNPMKAVELFGRKKDEISMLLTDVRMPEMNGVELAYELLKIKPDLKVIFMSGYSADILSGKTFHDKPPILIDKPFSFQQLQNIMSEVLTDENN